MSFFFKLGITIYYHTSISDAGPPMLTDGDNDIGEDDHWEVLNVDDHI